MKLENGNYFKVSWRTKGRFLKTQLGEVYIYYGLTNMNIIFPVVYPGSVIRHYTAFLMGGVL
jgi:hypothetical protein